MRAYEGKTDAEVLERAQAALVKAKSLRMGTPERAIQWAAFDAAMAELSRRAMAYALWKIHEAEAGDETEADR